jgi:alpha-L-fucosidase
MRAGAAAGLAAPLTPSLARAAPGPFESSWDSLQAGYAAPDWFRDAKLGIWAHWTAQCVPEFGDWYARNMYIQGDPAYDDHLKRYGHPTKVGFMEMNNLWKAENWDPEVLMELYKAAGAQYFVALANHHDNFDAFDSRHHPWNSVRIGPKRDIVGTWAKVARAQGLRFGVSNHSAHAWHWFQTAYGYDPEGPLAGARYDAFTLTKADGAGKWWDGLDPQQLYAGRNIVVPDGITSIKAMKDWHDAHDGQWHEEPPPNDPNFARQWQARCKDLVDKYRPDLLYFDDWGLPLGQTGIDMTAYYYNASRRWSHGAVDVVVNAKNLTPAQRTGVVEDIERGGSDVLRPQPWQTDTCIGNWHYDRALFERHGYKTAKMVIQRLVDVVSKNGNLLLSIPVRGDGTIDQDEFKILGDMARWMAVNNGAIFASRPWKVFGEGPTHAAAGQFSEGQASAYGDQDIRFTTRAGALHAVVMEWPDDTLTITSLAAGSPLAPGAIERVELLGATGALDFERGPDGLTIKLNGARPVAFAPVFRIHGAGLV